MEPRLLTLSAEALPGYDACLRDVLALLDRVSVQPAIAHAPALRLVLEDRAAMLPGLRAALCPLPAARVVTGPRAPEADAPALASCDATEPPAPIQAATADARLARKRERQAAWKRAKVARLRAEQAGEAGQAEPARRPRVWPKWTPERLAVLRQHAGKMRGRELLAAVNALPGPPVASTGAMRVQMRKLGLESAPGLPPLPEGFDPRGQDEASRAAMRERARLLAVAGGLGDWTDDRLALLRAEYATAASAEALLARINALPGNPIASTESMRHRARTLGIRRPRKGGDPEHLAKMNAARSQQAAARREAQQTAEADHVPDTTEMVEGAPTIKQDMKVATPATIEPGLTVAPEPATLNPWASTSPYRLTADAEAEALDMLRAGQGAKALHEEFGGRLEWWQAWAARARQAGRAA